MFYVKDDDMDGLFRKAAENFDIDAEQAADFNSVLKALSEEGNDEEPKPEKKKRRFILFWWLLLLPLAGALIWKGGQLYIAHYSSNKQAISSNAQKVDSSTAAAATIPEPINKSGQAEAITANQTTTVNNGNTQMPAGRKQVVLSTQTPPGVRRNPDNKILISNNKEDFSITLAQQNKQESNPRVLGGNQAITADKANSRLGANNALQNDSLQKSVSIAAAENKQQLPRISVSDSSAPGQQSGAKTIKSPRAKKSYFYAGLNAAMDVTFIKFQKTTSPGINAGFVAGYKINQRWQVESGLMFDKKNYYTAGQYFDKTDVPYLNYVDLKSVNGYCKMLEIPLNLRYNFGEKKNHQWFVSAGVSSYLMKQEYYDYGYVYNGDYRERDYTYEKQENDWLAVMNLGGGYELKAGSKNHIRFEPYYKIPLRGVGTGNLPLSSAGLNVAFTRQIP